MQNYSDLNLHSLDSGRPYIDLETSTDYIVREFGDDIDPIELMWHRDDEDRLVEILEVGQGWQFQYDEELPLDLKPTMSFNIQRHQWHRVIKGEGKLVLKIQK